MNKRPDLSTYTFRDEWIDDILSLAERAGFDLALSDVDGSRSALAVLSDAALWVLEGAAQQALREKLIWNEATTPTSAPLHVRIPEKQYLSRFSRQWIWERSG